MTSRTLPPRRKSRKWHHPRFAFSKLYLYTSNPCHVHIHPDIIPFIHVEAAAAARWKTSTRLILNFSWPRPHSGRF